MRAGIACPLDYPWRTRPATIFARLTDKTRTVLNNGKARLRQRGNGSKHNLRQVGRALASIPQMRKGSDPVLVPHGWNNGEQQPWQPHPPQQRDAAIEARGARGSGGGRISAQVSAQ